MSGFGADQGAAVTVLAVLGSPGEPGEGKPDTRWRTYRNANPQTRAGEAIQRR
jgi:hypothetical protein